MPPKVLFSREEIIEAGFNVVRQEGLEGLTARRVARELKCTVRPIYHHFNSMDELKNEVLKKAGTFSIQYLLEEDAGRPFLGMGMGYLHFAMEEEALFKTVYMTRNKTVDYHNDRIKGLIERLKKDPEMQGLDEQQLININLNMWIYTHGLATLMSIDAIRFTPEEAADHLYRAGRCFISIERSRGQQPETDSEPP